MPDKPTGPNGPRSELSLFGGTKPLTPKIHPDSISPASCADDDKSYIAPTPATQASTEPREEPQKEAAGANAEKEAKPAAAKRDKKTRPSAPKLIFSLAQVQQLEKAFKRSKSFSSAGTTAREVLLYFSSYISSFIKDGATYADISFFIKKHSGVLILPATIRNFFEKDSKKIAKVSK